MVLQETSMAAAASTSVCEGLFAVAVPRASPEYGAGEFYRPVDPYATSCLVGDIQQSGRPVSNLSDRCGESETAVLQASNSQHSGNALTGSGL